MVDLGLRQVNGFESLQLTSHVEVDIFRKDKEIFIYNICDHEKCYNEVESQAISYTAGVPPVAAAILIANGKWDVKEMVNVEELDPDPFIDLLNNMGLKTVVRDNHD